MSASKRQAQHGVRGAQSPLETQRGVGVLATGYHPPPPHTQSITISKCPSHRVDRSDQNSEFNLFFFQLWQQRGGNNGTMRSWRGICAKSKFILQQNHSPFITVSRTVWSAGQTRQSKPWLTGCLYCSATCCRCCFIFPDGRQTNDGLIPLQISTSKMFLTPLLAARISCFSYVPHEHKGAAHLIPKIQRCFYPFPP